MVAGGRPPPTAALGPGFRFHPTDEELLRYYLKRKVLGKPVRFDCIAEIDLYKFDPWDLPGQSHLKTRDLEWYFFTALDRKYGHGSRTNRATGHGYWKTTGKDQAIIHQARAVGMRKTLVYHAGRAPSGERTNWVMHEYRLEDEELAKKGIAQDAFVLCRIFEKSGAGPKNGEQYGAPFVEEEWEDEKDEITLLKENIGNGTANVGGILRAVTVNTMTPSPLPQQDIHQRVNVASETDHVALGMANADLQFRTSHPCLDEQLLLDKKDGYTDGTEFSQEDCIEMNDVNDPIEVGCPSCSYGNMLNRDVLCHDGHDICNELLLNEGYFLQYQDFLCCAEDDQLNLSWTKLPEDDWFAEFLKQISDDDDKVQNIPIFDSFSPSTQQLRSIETSVNAERKGVTRTYQCKCSIKIER